MAEFKGFKQVTLSAYTSYTSGQRKNYLWLVRDTNSNPIKSSIYFGNRKYADVSDTSALEEKINSIITSLGSAIDENGEWVGFLPLAEHEILGNAGVTSISDALEALEAAILNNADLISGKVSKAEYEEKIAEIESEISGATIELEKVSQDIENLSGDVASLVTKTTDLETELDLKANAADVYTKSQTYSKTEIDGKIVGAFKFKGNAEAISADETTLTVSGESVVASEANEGFVYQINDAEYASNGEKWVKLGFNIDLSQYATIEYVDAAISAKTSAIEDLTERVDIIESALTKEIEDRQDFEERIDSEIGNAQYEGNSITEALGNIQDRLEALTVEGDDVENDEV